MSVPGPLPAGSISDDTLDRAVAQGVLTAQQVEMLRYLERTRTAPTAAEPTDDEKFRFINGFSDIFVTIGLGLFLGALAYFSGDLVGSFGTGIVVAMASWLLAEYFTRRSRMALPSIVLLLVYAAAVFLAVAGEITQAGRPLPPAWSQPLPRQFTTGDSVYRLPSLPAWRRWSPRSCPSSLPWRQP